jgi:hypothetical protein
VSYTVTEGEDEFVILRLNRSGNTDLTTNLTFMTMRGTADESDFTPVMDDVVFEAGVTSVVVNVMITDDATLEDDEIFTATIISREPNVIVDDARSNANIAILDNDRVTIGFVSTLYSVNENDEIAAVSIAVLSGQLSEEVVVRLSTENGSATDQEDYTGADLMLTFGPDSTEQPVMIPITNDTVYEQLVEEFISNLVLVTDNANVIVRPARATVRIFDDDIPAPVFEMTMYTVPEDDPGSVKLCVDIGVEITESITYTITTAQKNPSQAEDSDFTDGTTITIAPTGTESCIDFTDLVVNDNIGLEGNEAFTILIDGSMAMVTITEDDDVSIGFNPTAYMVLEGGSVDLIIERVGDAEVTVVATVLTRDGSATAGEDYVRLDGVEVTFLPGEFTQRVTLNTLTGVPAEGDEDLAATLTAVDARVDVTQPEASIIITENVVPSISFSTENVEVREEDGSAEICLDLSVPLSTDLQVVVSASAGTADSGSDFSAGTQTASFTAGSTRACVNFVIIDDDLALEGDETFTATFETPDGFASVDPSTATVTIIDNDVFTVQFTEDDYSYVEGDPNARVCLEGIGQIVQPATATVSSLAQGTATGYSYSA